MSNDGEVTIDDIEVYAKFNSDFYLAGMLSRSLDKISTLRGLLKETDYVDGKPVSTVYWKFGSLPPKSSLPVEDLLFSRLPTEGLEWSTKAQSADGVELDLSGIFSVSLDIQILITARDIEPKKFDVSIGLKQAWSENANENMRSYIQWRRNIAESKGQVFEEANLVGITFAKFEEPEFAKIARTEFATSIDSQDEKYLEEIHRLVPSEYPNEAAAREYLVSLKNNRTLVGIDPIGVKNKVETGFDSKMLEAILSN